MAADKRQHKVGLKARESGGKQARCKKFPSKGNNSAAAAVEDAAALR